MKSRKDLNKITRSAVAKPTLESNRLLTTAYCARFLCGDQQLGVPCMQFACRWRHLGEQTEPLHRDVSMLATLTSLCSRILCSDHVTAATSRRVALPDSHDAVAAKRKFYADLVQCISSRCGAFSDITESDVWRRLSCIARWCHRPML